VKIFEIILLLKYTFKNQFVIGPESILSLNYKIRDQFELFTHSKTKLDFFFFIFSKANNYTLRISKSN